MRRLFKMPIRQADGRYRDSDHWYFRFRDPDGELRCIALYAHRRPSQHVAERIVELVEYRESGAPLPPDLQRWIDKLPGPTRTRLGKFGLVDGAVTAPAESLAALIDGWIESLRARELAPRYITQAAAHVRAIVAGIAAAKLGDVTAVAVERWLASQRRKGTLSACTRNHYLASVKAFCGWLVARGTLTASPVAHLTKLNEATDRRRVRRALTAAELRRLIETTATEPDRWGMTGAARALLYQFAAETGLRAGSIRSLTSESFDLAGTPPTVTVEAESHKSGRIQVVPLRRATARALKAACNGATGSVFAMPHRANLASMLREDLTAAKVPIAIKGRIVDFHALRRTLATQLQTAGVNPRVAQEILGHSQVSTTLDLYTDVSLADMAAALEKVGKGA